MSKLPLGHVFRNPRYEKTQPPTSFRKKHNHITSCPQLQAEKLPKKLQADRGVMSKMLSLEPDLLLSVGDLSYADGWAERWDIFGTLVVEQSVMGLVLVVVCVFATKFYIKGGFTVILPSLCIYDIGVGYII